MPQAIVNISEEANRVVNIVKAKYGFKDKSQAINQITMEYGSEMLEPELRPEFIERMKTREPVVHFDSFDEFKKYMDSV